MGRHRLRHQQPIGVGFLAHDGSLSGCSSSKRSSCSRVKRWLWLLPPALCLMAGVLAWWAGGRVADVEQGASSTSVTSEHVAGTSSDAADAETDGTIVDGAALQDWMPETGVDMWEQLLGQADEVKASSTDAFLSDLAACEDAQQEDVTAVAWTSEQTLSDLASDVVRRIAQAAPWSCLPAAIWTLRAIAWGAVLLDEKGGWMLRLWRRLMMRQRRRRALLVCGRGIRESEQCGGVKSAAAGTGEGGCSGPDACGPECF